VRGFRPHGGLLTRLGVIREKIVVSHRELKALLFQRRFNVTTVERHQLGSERRYEAPTNLQAVLGEVRG